jgi:lysophospholipase L1-like esterase
MSTTSHLSRAGHTGRFALVVASILATLGLLVSVGGTTAASAASTKYYVSLGDSYSVGYQPSPKPGGATSGYTAVVAAGTHMKLVNFGCGGATTTSILETVGCAAPYGPPAATGRATYPTQTQAAAAEAFIRAHQGAIGLITVSIGGNDVTACATNANPVSCVATVTTEIKTHVGTLAQGLRAAAGAGVPIIGLTYPDVVLGKWVYPSSKPNKSLATLSVTAFKSLINPALSQAYTSAGGTFVDVTAKTGAYTPLTKTIKLAPYGSIPVAVASVCKLTWYCQLGNIHAKTVGYRLIGAQILAAYRSAT